MGESINFINRRQYDTHVFNLNGPYALGTNIKGIDGIFPILFDMEIVGLSIYNRIAGVSGNSEIELEWLSGSGVVEGTIFSTNPSLNFSSGNDSYLIYNAIDNVNVELPSGAVAPVFSKLQFDAGDALRFELLNSQQSGEDLSISIHFRPR